jgi:hypothetical protein
MVERNSIKYFIVSIGMLSGHLMMDLFEVVIVVMVQSVFRLKKY